MKILTYTLALALTLSMLSACGWRLRGGDGDFTSSQSIYLTPSQGEVYQYVKDRLERQQIESNAAEADMNIILGKERFERRDSSVNNNLQTTQYKLTLSIPYEVVDNTGQALTPNTKAEIIRYYTFNQNAINSSAKEEQALRKEMVRQVGRQILQRTVFLGRQKTNTSL